MDAANSAPVPANPEAVSPDTVQALLTQVDVLVGNEPSYPIVGRNVQFVTEFEGGPAKIFVHIHGIEKADPDGGSIGGVIVYAPGPEGYKEASTYAFVPADDGITLKKELPAETDGFVFAEEPPEYDAPPAPEPDSKGVTHFDAAYNDALAAAQKEAGFDEWLRRRGEALSSYMEEQHAEHARLGFDVVYENEAQELLRVLEAGEAILQRDGGRTSRAAAWVAKVLSRFGWW